MKNLRLILLSLLVLLAAACRREIPHVDRPSLGITLEFPHYAVTRADEGEVPASEAENAIYDLKVWIFRSDSHEAVAQLITDSPMDFPQGGGVRRYALPVTSEFAVTRPKVDVFVLANSASIGCTLDANSPYEAVNEAVFGGSELFSPEAPVHAVPANGLPMSGAGKNLTISGEAPSLSITTVALSRAVSKIRYVFCQMLSEDNTETYTIDRIVLDGNQIAASEYVFATGSSHIAQGGYVAQAMETTGPGAVAATESPELYIYAGQDGPTYENLVQSGIDEGKLTHCGTTYLRESDKALTGTVYYSITENGITEHKTRTFTMATAGDFGRNHTWTLFGYFISQRTLLLSVSVAPWDKNNYTIDFSTSSLMVTGKFSVDTPTPISTGVKDHYNVYVESYRPARGKLFVTAPQGGRLHVIPVGLDASAFVVTPSEIAIDPTKNSGRIDITVGKNYDYPGDPTGKTITLSFEAYTPDGEREISGASECVDQVYHFIL